jgi:hypothetical protein
MSKSKQPKLSVTETIVLDAVEQQPGLVAQELAPHLPVGAGSVAALLSRMMKLKQLNRVKVPLSSAYRYYPLSAALPAGYEAWDNKLVKRYSKPKAGNGAAPEATATVLDYAPRAHPKRTVLITLQIGDRESVTLTPEQAQDVFEQLVSLSSLFGATS